MLCPFPLISHHWWNPSGQTEISPRAVKFEGSGEQPMHSNAILNLGNEVSTALRYPEDASSTEKWWWMFARPIITNSLLMGIGYGIWDAVCELQVGCMSPASAMLCAILLRQWPCHNETQLYPIKISNSFTSQKMNHCVSKKLLFKVILYIHTVVFGFIWFVHDGLQGCVAGTGNAISIWLSPVARLFFA